ncbi:MAG: toprim domain-containing protein [Patescibacteria group bacterium]|nr:toprim domain-containing protein [Patescibacteria group bacterium]
MANHSIEELTELIAEFPGLGPRQARRIVQFLLYKNGGYREKLTKLILTVAANAKQCASCYRFDDLDTHSLCRICADSARENTLMVVEKDVDIEGMEASSAYRGRYFVLGGLMSMTGRKNPPSFRDTELAARIAKDGLSEVILALATTPEGDYTADALMRTLTEKHSGIKITLLGRGLSVGAEIEYADTETLRNALKNRA